jgi:hypothetical protein
VINPPKGGFSRDTEELAKVAREIGISKDEIERIKTQPIIRGAKGPTEDQIVNAELRRAISKQLDLIELIARAKQMGVSEKDLAQAESVAAIQLLMDARVLPALIKLLKEQGIDDPRLDRAITPQEAVQIAEDAYRMGKAGRSGSGKNEPHGSSPGTKLVEQVQKLEEELAELIKTQGPAAKKKEIRQKIININKKIDKKIKGETHHMR